MYEVIIVGGGPAGLGAAIILARARRSILICDAGSPRNARARAAHGYPTRDGISPLEFLALAREEVLRYESVQFRFCEIVGARRREDGYEVTARDGACYTGRKLLLCTGVVDELPDIPGFAELYGRGVYHCPYCDGYELRDRPLAVYGQEPKVCTLAVELLQWSRDMVVLTDGAELPAEDLERLNAYRVAVVDEKIRRLRVQDGALDAVEFDDGDTLPRRAIFFQTGQYKRHLLPQQLGCDLTTAGALACDDSGQTNVGGVFCAGDNKKSAQFIVVAAGEGALAAVAINRQLFEEDTRRE